MAATSGGIKAGKAFVLIEAVDKTAFVLRRIGERMKAFAGRMTTMGQDLIRKGLIGLLPTILATRTFAAFDDSMRKVEARSSGTTKKLSELREQAKELGRTTSFTASQIAELQAKLAQKGFNRGQILQMPADIMSLARAAGEGREEDPTIAADLVSGTLRAFRREASDAGQIADIFSAAVNNSNFTLDGLITAMSIAGPVAAQFQLGLEEVVATLAGMTNLNMDASTSGTAFRNMLLKLSDAAGRNDFNASLQRMTGRTIEFTDAANNLRELPELLFEIGEATKHLGTAERGELLNNLFGLRAITPAMALGQGENPFRELLTLLKKPQGVAAETAAKMDSGIGGAFRRFLSAVEGTAIAVGEIVAGPLSALTDWVTSAVGKITEWITTNKNTVLTVVPLTAATVGLGSALLAAGLIVKLVGVAFIALAAAIKIALAAFLFPITLVLAGLKALHSGIIALGGSVDFTGSRLQWLGQQFTLLLSTVQKTWSAMMQAILAGRLDLAAQVGWAGLKVVWLEGTDFLRTIWDGFVTGFMNGVTSLQIGIAKGMTELWDGVRVIWTGAIGGLKVMLLQFVEFIANTLATEIGDRMMRLGQAMFDLGVETGIPGLTSVGGPLKKAGESIVSMQEGVQQQREQAETDLEEGIAAIGQENIDKFAAMDEEERRIIQARRDAANERAEERSNALHEARRDLDDAMRAVQEETAAMNEAVENAVNQIAPEPGIDASTFSPEPARASGIVKGLEKGTVEALEQAMKNAQQEQQMTTLLDKTDVLIGAVEDVEDAVSKSGGLVGV